MGYTTDFEGFFILNKEPSAEVGRIMTGLSTTRRMKRSVDEKKYGIQGEFYFGKGEFGQNEEPNIVDYNQPPDTQPGLWCHWELVHDQDCDEWFIQWDGGEKFYNYIEWLEYIIEKVLKPEGLVLQGEITWQGEDRSDMGKIEVSSNVIRIRKGTVTYR